MDQAFGYINERRGIDGMLYAFFSQRQLNFSPEFSQIARIAAHKPEELIEVVHHGLIMGHCRLGLAYPVHAKTDSGESLLAQMDIRSQLPIFDRVSHDILFVL
jgi:hypothetical protein